MKHLLALGALLLPGVLFAATDRSHGITLSLNYDPKTLDPAKVDDEASEMVRYFTGGVLLRTNRRTQQIEPELAESWSVSTDGKLITFRLRNGLKFSDGSQLRSIDVASTLKRVLSPETAAPVADEFLMPGSVTVDTPDPLTIRVHLSKRVITIGKVFDEIAIEPAGRITEGRVTAGPFVIADYKRGDHLQLQKNPNYWKRDTTGVQLPYLSSVRLDIVSNREQEELRFMRHEYAVMESVPAGDFNALAKRAQGLQDVGPSLNTEQMWFNQAPNAPIAAWEKKWFADRDFRAAVSLAIRRDDLARIAYDGHATPANGFIASTNTLWYNTKLQPARTDIAAAMRLLAGRGFHKVGTTLMDADGHPVSFSILTNAGNKPREKMAALIQQDLLALGMQVNVVTLDFPALIDRLMHSQNYEAAMLGLSNVEPDPSSMANVWMSSSPNHQWNPSQKSPSTPWEAELDKLVATQAEASSQSVRKAATDRVQQIVAEQLPFIYLVHPNILCAIDPQLENAVKSVLHPAILSNIESVRWK